MYQHLKVCHNKVILWVTQRDAVTFIRWSTAIPSCTAGSLQPSYLTDRLVCLTVRQAYAVTLTCPVRTSVSIWFKLTIVPLRYYMGNLFFTIILLIKDYKKYLTAWGLCSMEKNHQKVLKPDKLQFNSIDLKSIQFIVICWMKMR